jgi:DMSO/TMAO reductase YedYZ heme-binding membrane subunit
MLHSWKDHSPIAPGSCCALPSHSRTQANKASSCCIYIIWSMCKLCSDLYVNSTPIILKSLTSHPVVHPIDICTYTHVLLLFFLYLCILCVPLTVQKEEKKKEQKWPYKVLGLVASFLLAGFTSCCLYFFSAPSLFCTILKTTLQDDPWSPRTF